MDSVAAKVASRSGVFLSGATVTSLLFINACDLFYQCGCQAWWNGAAAQCNIHHTMGPHCPWCLDGGTRGYVVFALTLVVQAATAFHSGGRGWFGRLVLTLLVFPIVGGLMALLFGLMTGYWA